MGGPVYLRDVLARPMVLLGLAAAEIYAGMDQWILGSVPSSVVAASILVVAAVALLIVGYLAYRDSSPRAVDRYVVTSAISLFACGAVLSFGVVGCIPLFWSGLLAADGRFALVRVVRRTVPDRLRAITVVTASIIGVGCMLLLPLAIGLGSLPFIVLVMAGRILAPFVLGFAVRLRSVMPQPQGSELS